MLISSYFLCLFLWQIAQFLDSHGFLDYLESGLGSDENNDNLLDKLQDALGRGQNPLSILPSILLEPEIVTISDPDVGVSGNLMWIFVKVLKSFRSILFSVTNKCEVVNK